MLHQPSFCKSFHSNWCNRCPSTLQWPLEFPGSRVTKHYHGKVPEKKNHYEGLLSGHHIPQFSNSILTSHLPVERSVNKKSASNWFNCNSAIGRSLFECVVFLIYSKLFSNDPTIRWLNDPTRRLFQMGPCSRYLPCKWDAMKQQERSTMEIIRLQRLSSWWFQPIWKILVKMGIFPK